MDCIHHYASPLGGITLSSDGAALTGYAGGTDRKAKLLTLEAPGRNSPVIPKK